MFHVERPYQQKCLRHSDPYFIHLKAVRAITSLSLIGPRHDVKHAGLAYNPGLTYNQFRKDLNGS